MRYSLNSPGRQTQEGVVKPSVQHLLFISMIITQSSSISPRMLSKQQQKRLKTIKKDDSHLRSNENSQINQSTPSPGVDLRPPPDISLSQISRSVLQIQQFYIYSFFYQVETMIDSAFGRVLPESYQSGVAAVTAGEWEVFSEGRTESAVFGELYHHCIILKFKTEQGITAFEVPFHFDLKFELLRQKTAEKTGWRLEDVYSIKFHRGEKSFELRHPETDQLPLWRNHLTRRLNQLGFHELFRPLKEIGRGAFASVYLVHSHEDGRQYAVKAFSKEALAGEENGLRGLVNQIEIMRACNHRNLMRMEGVYESKNSLYLCVELLSGGQLYDLVKAKHKFTSQEIRAVMRALLSGAEALHAKGFMHRDLKPQNVLFREANGQCVIADFGLAQSVGGELMFVRCGTPGYVAPEIANLKSNKAVYSTACDLFSLGVIFHILALGKSPFPGKTFDEVLEQNKNCRFNFQTFEYNQLPISWLSLLKGLLEKDPKKRLTASQALAHDFFRKEPLITKNLQRLQKDKENRQPSMARTSFPECSSPLQKEKKVSIECNSPLMLTRHPSRKTPGLLRDDSCLKFKMKENLMTGKIEEGKEGRELPPISPLLKQKQPNKCIESRFKQLAEQNS